jgi:hypothetical protein
MTPQQRIIHSIERLRTLLENKSIFKAISEVEHNFDVSITILPAHDAVRVRCIMSGEKLIAQIDNKTIKLRGIDLSASNLLS